ncbi:mitochondrial S-adenosylmethionine carrier protein isoform X4 [Pteronotus mesoamericanus]|uniref:mitochondrial S-adenosylmethionine carrier protein isoform X4 n=1 Tax=Pteronotus mesoamericanus TaxID=1884717 RepID=UPI0023EC236C|nr:S-adenosylmethionine mitochondrial carrier protein isoform X4 [Pteronotus parnellii mesoamericanus]
MDRPGFTVSLVAGGVAGVSVDLILFPLDTIKTRLQSPQGFKKAGGFRGIYAGIPSAAIGSFPNAAAFFITYEYVKWFLHADSSSYLMPLKHMLAASSGEVIPFSLVQFPLWESLKALWSWKLGHVVDSWQSAVCGAFAGEKQPNRRPSGQKLSDWSQTKVDSQLQSPHLWMWQKQESCWQRPVPALLVAMSSLSCVGSGRHRDYQDYLQVSSLECQPSVWEVSSFLVLMTKLAAC